MPESFTSMSTLSTASSLFSRMLSLYLDLHFLTRPVAFIRIASYKVFSNAANLANKYVGNGYFFYADANEHRLSAVDIQKFGKPESVKRICKTASRQYFCARTVIRQVFQLHAIACLP